MKTWTLFLILLSVCGFLSILILKPYINYIILAIVLVFLTYPLYKRLASRINKTASALILIFSMILVVIIPSIYISATLFIETKNVFQHLSSIELTNLEGIEQNVSTRVGFDLNITENIKGIATQISNSAVPYVVGNIPKLTKTVVNGLLGFSIMLFSMFYFYVDGEKISNAIRDIIPMEKKYRNQFFQKIYSVTQALFLGIFLVALIQGIIAGIGYAIFGVSNPIFWAVLTVFVAIIPILGAPWAYVPISIYLMFNGHMFAGIGLLIYGIILVSQIDNIIRPRIVRMKSGIPIHPLAIILGVVGGVFLFGLVGVIIGPLILAIFMELLNIYRKR